MLERDVPQNINSAVYACVHAGGGERALERRRERGKGSFFMALLQASEPPPPAGQVTVGEFECRFLARDVEDETDWPNLTVS